MLLLLIIFASYPLDLYSFQLCNQNETFQCKKLNEILTENCRTVLSIDSQDKCVLQQDFSSNENLKLNLGDVFLGIGSDNILSMVVYPVLHWSRALVKFSEYNNPKTCRIFTIDKNGNSMDIMKYSCIWKGKQRNKEPLLIQISSENHHKKILFSIPDFFYFRNTVPPEKRQIFSYIDFTNMNKILLRIQPLPEMYEITHYKVEVFREKEKHSIMLDVRLIASGEEKKSIDFEYVTYSEEGSYYFIVSVIGKNCPEDFCFKTVTPRVHIARRGRPLVIGIVGASFLIPLVLFSFYLWNYKYRHQGGFVDEPTNKILVLFKPSFEKHNEVISTLIDSIEHFSNSEVNRINLTTLKEKAVEKFCSDSLIFATHIVYINPLHVDSNEEFSGLDYMTFNFLKQETKRKSSFRKLIVVLFSYSTQNVPPVLSQATRFDLVKDFSEFFNCFSNVKTQTDYTKNPIFSDLAEKIKLARMEAEILKNVTEDDEQPKEVDELI